MRQFRLCAVACLCHLFFSAPHLVAQEPVPFFATSELSQGATADAYEHFLSSSDRSTVTGDYSISPFNPTQFLRRLPFESSTRTTVDPERPATWYSGASAALEVSIYGDAIAKSGSDNPLWISPGSLGDTNLWAYVRQEDDSPVPRFTFEFVGDGGQTQTAMTDFYYEYDFSDLARIEIRAPGEQEHVAFWNPPFGSTQRLREIEEWLRDNYGTTKVRAPCVTCLGVSGGAFFGGSGAVSLAMSEDAFGPGGHVSVAATGTGSSAETSVAYSSEKLGQVTSQLDYSFFEEIRKSQLKAGKDRSESMIRKIVDELTEHSEALDLGIFAAWESGQKPRHDCGTYYCMTSLQVIVPREVVLGHSEETKWATFDITLLFTIIDLNSISRAELIVDAYADVKRSGKKLPPLAENIFRCPPLAKDKRNDERNIAETIEGWIRE